MSAGNSGRRPAAYFHISFADAEWNDLPDLGRQFLTAHEMLETVTNWNLAQQALIRINLRIPSRYANAEFISIEVHHEEE